MTDNSILTTRRGDVRLPGFFPVTTFGDRYPLDRLIIPYLPRLADALMVSYHYARPLDADPDQRPDIPIFVDSGGFALLFDGAAIGEFAGLPCVVTADGEQIDPASVLELQMQHAEIAATLDFPIPPSCDDPAERRRRFDATLSNAEWALANNRRRDLLMFASLQCWDAASAREAAAAYAAMTHFDRGFDGIAIGGLVPRLRDENHVQSIIEAVRSEWDCPIHAFGVGSPGMVRKCLEWGADSTDSSSYVKAAASGRHLNPRLSPTNPDTLAPLGRMQLALRNLSHLFDPGNDHLPLSAVPSHWGDRDQCSVSQ